MTQLDSRSDLSEAVPERPALSLRARPLRTNLILLFSDLLALSVAGFGAFGLRWALGLQWMEALQTPEIYPWLWPQLGLLIPVFAMMRLYPGWGCHPGAGPVEMLHRSTWAITIGFLLLSAWTFLFRQPQEYSRAIFVFAWALSLIFVPLGRVIVRHCWGHRSWWGHPVMVLGCRRRARHAVKRLLSSHRLDLKPVVVLLEGAGDGSDSEPIEGIPVVGDLEYTPTLAQSSGIRYAVVALPHHLHNRLYALEPRADMAFPHLMFMPRLSNEALGLEDTYERVHLLLQGPRMVKRVLDVSWAALFGVLSLPVVALIALAIKIDSPGPVFFGHRRIGRNGRFFKAWKFRTMVKDAEFELERYLQQHPELQEEWDQHHKLRNDPRITRVGRWLRNWSLDELPQLWNVLRGQMSLIGPRPIIRDEIPKYGKAFGLYLRVRPGLTGLWQVSGRNERSFRERVVFDTQYIRRWSIWLDLYILGRTFIAVFNGRGAY